MAVLGRSRAFYERRRRHAGGSEGETATAVKNAFGRPVRAYRFGFGHRRQAVEEKRPRLHRRSSGSQSPRRLAVVPIQRPDRAHDRRAGAAERPGRLEACAAVPMSRRSPPHHRPWKPAFRGWRPQGREMLTWLLALRCAGRAPFVAAERRVATPGRRRASRIRRALADRRVNIRHVLPFGLWKITWRMKSLSR